MRIEAKGHPEVVLLNVSREHNVKTRARMCPVPYLQKHCWLRTTVAATDEPANDVFNWSICMPTTISPGIIKPPGKYGKIAMNAPLFSQIVI